MRMGKGRLEGKSVPSWGVVLGAICDVNRC